MTIHFLPGMGADARIWQDYRAAFPAAVFHDWRPTADTAMTLDDYAAALITAWGITAADTLVGVSMGGIVGGAIANRLPGLRLIQVSSCSDIRQLNALVALISPLGRVFPFGKLAHVPNAVLPGDVTRLAHAMFQDSDPAFITWACSAIMAWKGCLAVTGRVSLLGDRDFLFPLAKQRPDHVIAGGSHLMVMTHVDAIRPILVANCADGGGRHA